MEQLRDIKEIVVVDDSSLLLLIATILIILMLLTLLAHLLRRRRGKRRSKPTVRMIAKGALQNIDYRDAKTTAYLFGEYAHLFVTEDSHETHQKIIEALRPYKYKKEVPPLKQETEDAIKAFLKRASWS